MSRELPFTEGNGEPAMILVMGVTGSGKSYFVNQLVAGAVREGHSIFSETKECRLVIANLNEDESVAVVDTPGFDDTTRSDAEILDEITEFLAIQYELGIRLKGIIYLHRITDVKMQGSALRYFRMFQKICGEEALGNVVLATTMWSQLSNTSKGLERDQELRETVWSLMESKGSQIVMYDGSQAMAEQMLMDLAVKDDVVLDIQREVCELGKTLEETAAGGLIVPELEAALEQNESEIRLLDRRIAETRRRDNVTERQQLERERLAIERRRKTRVEKRDALRKDVRSSARKRIESEKKESGSMLSTGIAVFAAVVNITIQIVVNILPLG